MSELAVGNHTISSLPLSCISVVRHGIISQLVHGKSSLDMFLTQASLIYFMQFTVHS